MHARPELPDGPYLVVGLARSGVAAMAALRARGETVAGVDRGEPPDAAGVEGVRLGADGLAELEHARAVVTSPGVPPRAPVLAAARARGIPVLGELELGWRLLPNEVIAVTGTNGKTTTVEWLAHIHRVAGLPVVAAGNVGTALSGLAGTLDPAATVVLEASSYQLHDTLAFAPECAVLLNLESDHLDWHGTLDAYRAAKLRIFANQGNDDVAVAPTGLGLPDLGGCARRVCVGEAPDADLVLRAGALWWDAELLVRDEELALPGRHNRANAAAAAAAMLARGADPDAVREGLRTFAGVPHRLEPVGERAGIRFVNDSKATNVASTLVALEAIPAPIRLILGGDDAKREDFTPLAAPVAARCARVYLIGEAQERLAAVLDPALVVRSGDLEHAVAAARADARTGDTILLSPACASFDQFGDFAERGERFKELVG